MIRLTSFKHSIKSYLMAFQRCKSNKPASKNDVVIYHNKKEGFFAVISLVSICQLFFWTYLGEFAFSELRDPYASIKPAKDSNKEEATSNDNDAPRQERRQLQKASTRMRVGLATISMVAGFSFCVIGFFYCYRSVKSLALSRGGIDVKIVTYAPFGSHRKLTVPLSSMSALAARNVNESPIPIRIKNYNFYFLVDQRGDFSEPRLYDRTVGIKRVL